MMTDRFWLRAVVFAVLIVGIWAESVRPQDRLERIQYNNPGLVVDLGVGLWAWPLPMDYDGDGDLDLVVSCPDKPYNGTYFFENPGEGQGARAKGQGEQREQGPSSLNSHPSLLPVFKPAVRIAEGPTNVQVSYVGGEPVVMTPAKIYADFRAHQYANPITLPLPQKIDLYQRIRANQWKLVDWEGDGDLDVIVGIGVWDDYGWDDAWDEQGNWKNGPLHGFVYLVENLARGRGSRGEGKKLADDQPWPELLGPRPVFAGPVKVATNDGKPVDVYGMPSPNFADFDGDGDLDLICGEFLDGFTWFENVGTREKPEYAAGRRLRTHEILDKSGEVGSIVSPAQEIEVDVQMITPVALDWDADGAIDIVCGDEDGRVAVLRNRRFVEVMRASTQADRFAWPVYFRQEAADVKFGALVTPFSVDWDGDGDEDLICGNTAGYIGFIENLSGGSDPQWAAPRLMEAVAWSERAPFTSPVPNAYVVRHMAGRRGSIQGPCEAKWGYTTLSVADWDRDGRKDVVVNDIWGRLGWYRGVDCSVFPAELRDDCVKQTRGIPFLAGKQSGYELNLTQLDLESRLGGNGADIFVNWTLKPGWTWWSDDVVRLNTQWRTTPCVVDWNEDGLLDIVMLDAEGYLALYQRIPVEERRDSEDVAAPRRVFKIDGPCEFDQRHKPVGDARDGLLRLNANRAGASGRRKLCFADWDGDGRLDLLVNSVNVNWLRNVYTDNEGFTWFHDEGPLDDRVLAGHTTSPTVVDWDNNDIPDLLVGAEDGHLYYKRNPRAAQNP